ncbi:MAG TPA: guanylate kinase [Candidatus Binataceae bacterium]|nr:guanylate kinase [Candidatus Binataceae bacterium]
MTDLPPRRGIVFILSAPSGAGKTTIWRAALLAMPEIEFSVSLTTRKPRGGEVNGKDYHFVSEDEFIRRREAGELAEWSHHFAASYGTPKTPLDRAIAAGRDILLDIEISGARQIRTSYPDDSVAVFVLPPSPEELLERLRKRGAEDEAEIQRRLNRAREETAALPQYDYLIVNDNVGASVELFGSIVNAERARVARLPRGFAPWKS